MALAPTAKIFVFQQTFSGFLNGIFDDADMFSRSNGQDHVILGSQIQDHVIFVVGY